MHHLRRTAGVPHGRTSEDGVLLSLRIAGLGLAEFVLASGCRLACSIALRVDPVV